MDMVITAIEDHPKGKGRVSVYLNDRFAFVLYKGELSKYGLETGTVMTDELYERIMTETINVRAKKRALNLLQRTDRTEADVRKKLSEGGYPDDAIDSAIEYLYSYHYLDDLRYASDYIGFKQSSMSRRMIISKLLQKGIKKETIEEAFAIRAGSIGDGVQNEELDLIKKLIKKRCPLGIDAIDAQGRQKLYAYLYAKGFQVSSIDRAVSELNCPGDP